MLTLHRVCGSTIATLLIAALTSPAHADEFDGCGTLFQGVECMLFSADAGGDYLLDDAGRVPCRRLLASACITNIAMPTQTAVGMAPNAAPVIRTPVNHYN